MQKKAFHAISKNIKKYRLLNNMTQEQLASILNLDTQYYAQLERGERNFTIEKIIRVCSTFHIGIENIIEVDSFEKEDTSQLLENINSELEQLSFKQLSLIEKFIHEIIPYVK